MVSAWETVRVVDYELRGDGDEVRATWTQEMRGKGGDVPMRLGQSADFAVRAGKVTRIRYFNLAPGSRHDG